VPHHIYSPRFVHRLRFHRSLTSNCWGTMCHKLTDAGFLHTVLAIEQLYGRKFHSHLSTETYYATKVQKKISHDVIYADFGLQYYYNYMCNNHFDCRFRISIKSCTYTQNFSPLAGIAYELLLSKNGSRIDTRHYRGTPLA